MCVCVCVLRSEEHTSELQSHLNLVCRLLLENTHTQTHTQTTPRAHNNQHVREQLAHAHTHTTRHTHTHTLTHTYTQEHTITDFLFLMIGPTTESATFPCQGVFRA